MRRVTAAEFERRMAALMISIIGLLCIVPFGDAQFSIDIQPSAQEVTVGGQVSVVCDITNVHNTSFTLLWIRRRHGNVANGMVTSSAVDEESIGTNSHVEDHWRSTGRYSAKYEIVTKLIRVKFILTITDVKAIDSGEIGCRIPIAKIEVFRPITVLVPARSIRLTSRNSIASHTQSYVDGEIITFTDGETRSVSCRVNGSHPAADVKIMVGDDDITERFTKNTELVRTGPINNTVQQDIYYVTELYTSAMTFGFELSGKSLRCVANIQGSNFTAISTHIVAHFNSYKPKFINCTGPRVVAALHQNMVRLACNVQAQPPITDAWISWPRGSPSDRVMKLCVGKRDGHYHAELRPHNPDNALQKVVSLNVDKIYPQHFINYTFVAQNAEGISEMQIELFQSEVAVSNAVLARGSVAVITTLSFMSCRLFSL